MVQTLKPAKMSPGMIRFVTLLSVALVCTLSTHGAPAQDSDSDVLTRIDRLEETIRNLTGQVEQLQYRDQQLEQKVQRLQEQMQGGTPAAGASPPPAGQYAPSPPPQYTQTPYSPPAYPPPAAQYSRLHLPRTATRWLPHAAMGRCGSGIWPPATGVSFLNAATRVH